MDLTAPPKVVAAGIPKQQPKLQLQGERGCFMHRRILVALVLLFPLVVLSAGCALTLHGKQRTMSVNSTPPGAKVTVDGFPVTTTPGIASFPARSTHVVTVEKDGCQSQSRPIPTSMYVGALIEEILLPPGLIGIIVDFATGAIWHPAVQQVDFALDCKSEAPKSEAPR